MPAACKLVFAVFVLAGALACDVPGSAPYVVEERSIGTFHSLAVSFGMEVNVEMGARPSLTVGGFGDLRALRTPTAPYVGTLLLALLPGTCLSNVVVNLTVTEPLARVAALSGSHVTVGAVAGPMSAADHSSIRAVELVSSGMVGIQATGSANVSVSQGSVRYLSVSASSRSSVSLGSLTAGRALVTAAFESSIWGMVAETGTISLTGRSRVDINVTNVAVYSCASSFLRINGSAGIRASSNIGCHVETPGQGQSVILP